jgi:alanine-glyoxylate transaminase/serine-glyoxylate transaminase/serine-pyruvate transaminase
MTVETHPQTATETSGRILLGPGPSMIHPRVYQAMAQPICGHLDPQFLELMNGIQNRLREVFCTNNPFTLSVSGTGSAGMEASLANLIEPGDGVLVCVNGVFGSRMCDIVDRLDGNLIRIDRPWGEVFDPTEIEEALAAHPEIKVVSIVHAETSTGAHQPLEDIGRICREADRLLVVDAVTSLGGTELEVDRWMIDVCFSGTQKCLSCPPGLAPLTLGPRAIDRMHRRKTKTRSWYLDLGMIERYWLERSRTYHHTAPITMNYALFEALDLILDEGLDDRFERHRIQSRALMAGLETLGFRPFAQSGHRLPMLNAVHLPPNLDDFEARTRLRDEFNIEVGGGLGELAGQIWRIGLMGESARPETVLGLLSALEEIIGPSSDDSVQGAATRAAQVVYDS